MEIFIFNIKNGVVKIKIKKKEKKKDKNRM